MFLVFTFALLSQELLPTSHGFYQVHTNTESSKLPSNKGGKLKLILGMIFWSGLWKNKTKKAYCHHTPKGQASEQMADNETTKQNKKLFIGPLQQASMLSLPNFPTDKACCNKPPKFQFTNYFFRNISCRKFHKWHLDGVIVILKIGVLNMIM